MSDNKNSLMLSAVNNLCLNRNMEDYVNILDELLLSYVVTDEFTSQPIEERKSIISGIRELQETFHKLAKTQKEE